MPSAKLFIGDALAVLKSFEMESIDMVMTSPPYWSLRDYGIEGQIGLEPTFEEYIDKITAVCSELMRVLKPTRSLYLNLGDTYAGSNMGFRDYRLHKSLQDPAVNPQYPISLGRSLQSKVKQVRRKSLLGIPWRIAIRLTDNGWILRNDIIWHKTNGLPASVKDRLSSRYEHLFHFVKSERYYYNLDAIREPYKPSALKRFGGLLAQNFIKKASKYNQLNLPPTVQFSQSRTPVPNWLRTVAQSLESSNRTTKVQQLYMLSKGRTGHGHYKGGVYKGILTNTVGKNPGDVLSLASSSYKGAHFSVYPEKLCIKPILSSCPPLVCSKCGAPKREVVGLESKDGMAFNIRVTDAQRGKLMRKWGGRVRASMQEIERYGEFFYRSGQKPRVIAEGCNCESSFIPGVVLDPFVGSGTTMKVATELGRRALGIDINPEYVTMVQNRIRSVCPEELEVQVAD